MQVFLGIDGGGTGCRAALCDAQGRILGRGAAGPANISTDTAGALANILTASNAALDAAGGVDPARVSAVLGLAGANVSRAAAQLSAGLPFARHRIVSDAMTATVGALRGADGIVAAMGTGSVFGLSHKGTFRQFGGRGFVLGDEGSGAVLGRALLAEALRAEDGFAPMTPLLQSVLDGHGGAEGVIAFSLRASPAEFAQFAPKLLQGDDPAAERIMTDAVMVVRAMINRLQTDPPLPVVFLGGLAGAYAARLARCWDIRAPLGSGLDGALLLAQGAG
ncbi:BadF/BadG/BcrA/BcrD ATPase family protein [Szabonella alba]|uniref:ATPase n=1 Tax=Szabonella alba TaxID=2804194 RepID=A0A8K0VFS0_9RHOB|nr:BadF/BadG/BcrA/BcrD ATPase family protein [Szabonella alba]MBL4918522.1 ATPase [Szabonella alba]